MVAFSRPVFAVMFEQANKEQRTGKVPLLRSLFCILKGDDQVKSFTYATTDPHF
jgi:hypothetical protein